MKPIPHGTESGYKRGCRCQPCRQAHTNRVNMNNKQRRSTREQRLSFTEIEKLFSQTATAQEIAEAIGISRACVRRYKAEGMSLIVADRVATKLGFHPLCIWEEQYWTAQ